MRLTEAVESTESDRAAGEKVLQGLADAFERAGYSVEDIGRISKAGGYQQSAKVRHSDGTDEVVTTDLYKWEIAPAWENGPEWPVVQPAAPVRLPALKARPRSANSYRTTLVFPDPQFGFRRLSDGEMIPMQDEAAIDVALAVAKHVRPDRIVNLGDTCDFAEWSSKFAVLPEFVLTTQPTIDAAHEMLSRQVAITEDVTILDGNHDDRISKLITKNAMAALRLRPAKTPPEHWPVLSMPALLRLDDLGIKYVGAYPAGREKLTDGNGEHSPLFAIHGEKLDLAKVAKEERQSFIQGHTHHQGLVRMTYEIDGNPWLVWAMSPGCLCRTDGVVPSTHSGEDAHGRPAVRWENWHQGVILITEHDDGSWMPEIIPIHRGRAIWGGKVYEAA